MAVISDLHLKDAKYLAELYEKRARLVLVNTGNHGHRGNVLSKAIDTLDTEISNFFSKYDRE